METSDDYLLYYNLSLIKVVYSTIEKNVVPQSCLKSKNMSVTVLHFFQKSTLKWH